MRVVAEVVVVLVKPLEQEVQAVEAMAQLETILPQLLVVLEPLILAVGVVAEQEVHL
jgi:hypothetical protein